MTRRRSSSTRHRLTASTWNAASAASQIAWATASGERPAANSGATSSTRSSAAWAAASRRTRRWFSTDSPTRRPSSRASGRSSSSYGRRQAPPIRTTAPSGSRPVSGATIAETGPASNRASSWPGSRTSEERTASSNAGSTRASPVRSCCSEPKPSPSSRHSTTAQASAQAGTTSVSTVAEPGLDVDRAGQQVGDLGEQAGAVVGAAPGGDVVHQDEQLAVGPGALDEEPVRRIVRRGAQLEGEGLATLEGVLHTPPLVRRDPLLDRARSVSARTDRDHTGAHRRQSRRKARACWKNARLSGRAGGSGSATARAPAARRAARRWRPTGSGRAAPRRGRPSAGRGRPPRSRAPSRRAGAAG